MVRTGLGLSRFVRGWERNVPERDPVSSRVDCRSWSRSAPLRVRQMWNCASPLAAAPPPISRLRLPPPPPLPDTQMFCEETSEVDHHCQKTSLITSLFGRSFSDPCWSQAVIAYLSGYRCSLFTSWCLRSFWSSVTHTNNACLLCTDPLLLWKNQPERLDSDKKTATWIFEIIYWLNVNFKYLRYFDILIFFIIVMAWMNK